MRGGMAWTLSFHEAAAEEFAELPDDLQARLEHIRGIVAEHGFEKLPRKLTKHIEGELWEFRLKGRDSIARAFYVTRNGYRLIVVRVFTKKTHKTPRREIELAHDRAEEVT